MKCENNSIDSNLTGFAYAVEDCPKILPALGTVVFKNLEPNSYSDFGAELTTVARDFINPSRQKAKGAVTGLTVAGGFNIDFCQNNLLELLEGAFFANRREKANVTAITAVTATQYTATAGLNNFTPNDFIMASGFSNVANNGLKTVKAVTATTLTCDGLLAEATPTKGKLLRVGFKFAKDDCKLVKEGNLVVLTTTTKNLTDFGLIAGEYVFIGGDSANSSFATAGSGYGRVSSVASNRIIFDDISFVSQADAGVDKEIEIYFGTVLKNEIDPELIKMKSFTFERSLGTNNQTGKAQAEYISGAVIDEFNISAAQDDIVKADISVKSMDNYYRSGDVGDEVLVVKERLPALGEEGYNTTSDIRRLRMNIVDKTSSTSTPLFAYLTEWNLSIKNNLSENKAISVFGAIGISTGNFEVSGNMKAYFTDIQASRAVRNNADVSISAIFAKNNQGFVFDVPLVGLGNGKVSVEKDSPITIDIEPTGAINSNGYTAMYINFSYLPTVAV